MAIPAYLKIQLEFKMGSDGWSEIYYAPGTQPRGNSLEVIKLAKLRAKSLVSVGVIHHARVSTVAPGARAFRFALRGITGGQNPVMARDVGAVCVETTLYSGDTASRKLYLRGVPDTDVMFDVKGVDATSVPDGVKGFITYLITAKYAIKHLTPVALDVAAVKVQDITVANGVVQFSGINAAFHEGDRVRVSGCRGFKASQFNGVWRIGQLVPVPGEVPPVRRPGFLATTRRLIDPGFLYVLNSGSIRSAEPQAYSYPPIDSWDESVVPGTKRVGRPTDSPRGRRSVTRR